MNLFRIVTTVFLLASPALAYEPAPGDGEYKAFGENGPGGNFGTQISINLQKTGPLVELKAGSDTGLNCTYFADLNTGFVQAIEGQCFEIGRVSLENTAEGAVLTAPELWPVALPLVALRVVLDAPTRSAPENGFDALGLTAGMTRNEIEAALAQRDWTVIEEVFDGRSPDAWGATRTWYAPAGSEGRTRNLPDHILVNYAGAVGVEAARSGDVSAISLRRSLNYKRADVPPELIALDSSLRDKYGIDGGVDLDGIGTSQNRFFDASGEFVLDRLEKGIPACRDYEKPARSDKPENIHSCVFELTVGKTARGSRLEAMFVKVTDRFADQQQSVVKRLVPVHQKLARISDVLQGGGAGGGATPPEL